MTARAVPTDQFRHLALIHSSDEELLAASVPFLSAGLEAGEVVLLHTTPEVTDLLTSALPPGPRPILDALGSDGERTTRAAPALQRFLDHRMRAGERPFRCVGQVPFPPEPDGQRDWARTESAFNWALAGYPLQSVCLYDTRTLPAEVIDQAPQTHPMLMTGSTPVSSPQYVDPADYLRRTRPTAGGPPVGDTPPAVALDPLQDLAQLRRCVYWAALRTQLSAEAVDEFTVAANEIASNALQHGKPPVRVQLWTAARSLLCTVSDAGAGFDDPLAGLRSSRVDRADHGLGLWAVRQLCDQVTFAHQGGRFVVRLWVEQ